MGMKSVLPAAAGNKCQLGGAGGIGTNCRESGPKCRRQLLDGAVRAPEPEEGGTAIVEPAQVPVVQLPSLPPYSRGPSGPRPIIFFASVPAATKLGPMILWRDSPPSELDAAI